MSFIQNIFEILILLVWFQDTPVMYFLCWDAEYLTVQTLKTAT